jgi:hypothetical protein
VKKSILVPLKDAAVSHFGHIAEPPLPFHDETLSHLRVADLDGFADWIDLAGSRNRVHASLSDAVIKCSAP